MTILKTESWFQLPGNSPNNVPEAWIDLGWDLTGFNNVGTVNPGRRANSKAFFLGNTTGSINTVANYWFDRVLKQAGALSGAGTITVGLAVTITAGTTPNFQRLVCLRTDSVDTIPDYTSSGPCVSYQLGGLYMNNGTLIKTIPTTGVQTYYIEIQNNTAGNVIVKIDGVQVYSASNWTATGGIRGVSMAAPAQGSGYGFQFQDVYVLDGNGSTNNTFLGDCRIEGLTASSNGSLQEQTSGTLANIQSLDGDTSYALLGAAGQRVTYNMTAPQTTTGTVAAVVVRPSMKKTTGSARGVKGLVRVSGTTYETSASKDPASSTDYTPVDLPFDVNPATSAAWSTAAVSALEAGVKLAS